jgi:UPF0716 family protein affecting phage T7 exclusion
VEPSSGRRSPPALVTSVVLGAAGLVLLLAGLFTSTEAVVVGGVAAATVSLVSALVWREQLIRAWRAERAQQDRRRRPR